LLLVCNEQKGRVTAGNDFFSKQISQTPDLPATHAVVATVAPFPAWRGSQDSRCAEPEV